MPDSLITRTSRDDNNPTGMLEVNMMNMGQGDCILMKTPLGRTIMVDCGTLSSGNYWFPDLLNRVLGFEHGTIDDQWWGKDKDLSDARKRKLYSNVFQVTDKRSTNFKKWFLISHNPNSPCLINSEYGKLDFLFITHDDADHYNNIHHVLTGFSKYGLGNDIRLGKVYTSTSMFSLGPAGTTIKKSIRHSQALDLLNPDPDGPPEIHQLNVNCYPGDDESFLVLHETLPNGKEFELRVLASGKQDAHFSDSNFSDSVRTNGRSIVLLVRFGEDSMLLTGDANNMSVPAVKQGLKAAGHDNAPVGLAQIPHHGAEANAMDMLSLIRKVEFGGLIMSAPNPIDYSSKHMHPRFGAIFKLDHNFRMEESEYGNHTIYCWWSPASGTYYDPFKQQLTSNSVTHSSGNMERWGKRVFETGVEIETIDWENSVKKGNIIYQLLAWKTDRDILVTGSMIDSDGSQGQDIKFAVS